METAFSLVSVLSDTVKSMIVKAYDADLTLALDLDPHLPVNVVGDSIRLRQVLSNLVSNALKCDLVGGFKESTALAYRLLVCCSDSRTKGM